MPHLVILYTPNLDARVDMTALCRALADTMVAATDDAGKKVFPTGGVRVLAYPAAHSAVADCQGDYAFAYLNLRMARGRPEAVRQRVGEALSAVTHAHFEALLTPPLGGKPYVGVTLHIDEGAEVFDAKYSTLHPLFNKA